MTDRSAHMVGTERAQGAQQEREHRTYMYASRRRRTATSVR